MPRFDYHCRRCHEAHEKYVSFENMDKVHCWCGAPMERQFPATTSNYRRGEYTATFMEFKPHHDEALDCDVHGFREKKEILKALDLQEAGDPVGGARNIETSPDAAMLGRQKETGRRLSDIQFEREAANKADYFTDVGVVNADGSETKVNTDDLKTL